jgi:hypothetical protein
VRGSKSESETKLGDLSLDLGDNRSGICSYQVIVYIHFVAKGYEIDKRYHVEGGSEYEMGWKGEEHVETEVTEMWEAGVDK